MIRSGDGEGSPGLRYEITEISREDMQSGKRVIHGLLFQNSSLRRITRTVMCRG